MIVLCFLLLLAGFAVEARVDFKSTNVYDEFDFKGQSTVIIDDLCADICAIYASITPESRKLAANLLIQLPTGFVSIADVAARIDSSTNAKLPLLLNRTAQLKIVNANAQLAAGPLVLYVTNHNYAMDPRAEFYEADGLNLPSTTFPRTVTVMSARPFTLQQAARDGNPEVSPQGLFATMSGLDGMCADSHSDCSCWSVFLRPSLTHFTGFTMEVNGPIISVYYDNFNHGVPLPNLIATLGITNKLQRDQADFVGSPGAHGCKGKQASGSTSGFSHLVELTYFACSLARASGCVPRLVLFKHLFQPYRSSLYDMTSPIHAEITSNESATFDVEIGTNTYGLTLTDDSGVGKSVTSTESHNPTRIRYNTQNLMVDWQPNGSGNDYFLVQWNGTTTLFVATDAP